MKCILVAFLIVTIVSCSPTNRKKESVKRQKGRNNPKEYDRKEGSRKYSYQR
ncbi:hypothetical protein [Labilibaculum euxinus]|uniref:Uncharacterized protein n=1 Tax=Labilibaculum euxinus TaxID=2686357 RepID=A0A7M4DBU9_9BACT|nr:hypothetical protein [Labilibaculum euxinus]MUP40128.1 hypothetical protein [Labilibaculum euxinus]MVB09333.1 hypothetical protein [Labilibaculum euxinus]